MAYAMSIALFGMLALVAMYIIATGMELRRLRKERDQAVKLVKQVYETNAEVMLQNKELRETILNSPTMGKGK